MDFPDYAVLSNPLRLKAKEIQALLSGGEAMMLFALAALMRENFNWQRIPLGAEALSQKVAPFRRGLDVGKASAAA